MSTVESLSSSPSLPAPFRPESGVTGPGTVPLWRSLVVLGLAFLLLVASWFNPPLAMTPHAGVVMELPTQVAIPGLNGGNFSGLNAPVSVAEHNIPARGHRICPEGL